MDVRTLAAELEACGAAARCRDDLREMPRAPRFVTGGAAGADLAWSDALASSGVAVTTWSGYAPRCAPGVRLWHVDALLRRMPDAAVGALLESVHGHRVRASDATARFVRRNIALACVATAVAAVARVEDGRVAGGTAHACAAFAALEYTRGRRGTIALWVFDQAARAWLCGHVDDGGALTLRAQPVLNPPADGAQRYAVVGARDLTECGRAAIERFARAVSRNPPTVVCLRRTRGEVVQDCDVYIGRACSMGGWSLPLSKWHNPYTVRECGSAEEAVRRYRAYLLGNPELLAQLGELRGKRLGCWCKPRPCHGDVLVELLRESDVY